MTGEGPALEAWMEAAMERHRKASDLIDELVALVGDDDFADPLGYIEDTDPEIIALALTGAVAMLVGLRDCTCPFPFAGADDCPIHGIDAAGGTS